MLLALIDLAGSIALLLWGVHMVRTGIERVFGSSLRRLLSVALGNRFKAFLAGLGVTALMLTSFTASGLVALVPALGAMLGANVGTTLIVRSGASNSRQPRRISSACAPAGSTARRPAPSIST